MCVAFQLNLTVPGSGRVCSLLDLQKSLPNVPLGSIWCWTASYCLQNVVLINVNQVTVCAKDSSFVTYLMSFVGFEHEAKSSRGNLVISFN